MAQLLKIEDCVSRYEKDVYRYTGQYIRLKSDRWKRMKRNWESERLGVNEAPDPTETPEPSKRWWKRREPTPGIEQVPDVPRYPITLNALKRNFREELFQFQLKWASSTIRERSQISSKLQSDDILHELLMELPDNYLLFYKPIVRMKKAETQLDVFLIGPDGIHAIVILDSEKGDVIQPSQDRFWECMRRDQTMKIISPIAAIQRMNFFLESVLDTETLDMKITYTVLCKKGFMNRGSIPPYIQIIDHTNFDQWFRPLKRQPSPIKAKQLRVTKKFIEHCVTTSFHRPEWETEKDTWQQINLDEQDS